MVDGIGGRCFVWSGMIKDVKNSRKSSSFPYQSVGIRPDKRAVASGERPVNVRRS